jgi:hypothetical protein
MFTTYKRFTKKRDLVYLNELPVSLDSENSLQITDRDLEIDLRPGGPHEKSLLREKSHEIHNYVVEDCNISPYRIGKIYTVMKEKGDDRLSKEDDGSSIADVYVRLDKEKVRYFDTITGKNERHRSKLLDLVKRYLHRLIGEFKGSS